jgi:hypothetical protein
MQVSTLFALFPRHWNELPEAEKNSIPAGDYWSVQLSPYPEIEKAVFLDSLFSSQEDGFPAAWRRFIRVGQSISEQLANLFELCFEKGYGQVVFADTICAAIPPSDLKKFLEATETKEMVLLPASDGSVLMAAMQLDRFSDWDFFRFYEPGSIVEVLSDCHEREIEYAVMEAYDLSSASQNLKELLKQNPSGKSSGKPL